MMWNDVESEVYSVTGRAEAERTSTNIPFAATHASGKYSRMHHERALASQLASQLADKHHDTFAFDDTPW